MTAALRAGGFDVGRRTFVLWLGVTPYLTPEAVFETLGALARFPGGAEVVFDYANLTHAIEEDACATYRAWRRAWRRAASRSAAFSKPLRSTSGRARWVRRDRGSRSRRVDRALPAASSGEAASWARRPLGPDGDALAGPDLSLGDIARRRIEIIQLRLSVYAAGRNWVFVAGLGSLLKPIFLRGAPGCRTKARCACEGAGSPPGFGL